MDSPQKPEQFKLLPNVYEAIRLMKNKGYYVFIATNQPGAAKGKTKLKTLYDINTMFTESLSLEGIDIDGVYMCPHYTKMLPTTKESFLIKECDCRKPKPGLMFKPKDIFNIDYDNSYMVGDSYTDVIAGSNAGLKTIFIGDLKCDSCKRLCDLEPDHISKDILEAAKYIN